MQTGGGGNIDIEDDDPPANATPGEVLAATHQAVNLISAQNISETLLGLGSIENIQNAFDEALNAVTSEDTKKTLALTIMRNIKTSWTNMPDEFKNKVNSFTSTSDLNELINCCKAIAGRYFRYLQSSQ